MKHESQSFIVHVKQSAAAREAPTASCAAADGRADLWLRWEDALIFTCVPTEPLWKYVRSIDVFTWGPCDVYLVRKLCGLKEKKLKIHICDNNFYEVAASFKNKGTHLCPSETIRVLRLSGNTFLFQGKH